MRTMKSSNKDEDAAVVNNNDNMNNVMKVVFTIQA